MSKSFLQIDASSLKDKNVENLIKIRLRNDDVIQFDFANFFIKSKYLLDKYKYSDAFTSIQSEIDEVNHKFNINDESIKYFIEFIEESEVRLPIELYKDIYTLCEYFCIPQFIIILDKISRKELFNDLNFTIQILQDSLTANNGLETKMTLKLENFLKERINECIQNFQFRELPVSTIFRIFDQTKEIIDQNLLVDFILDSIDTHFILLKFVKLHKLEDDKVNELIKFFCEQDSKKQYLEYMSFNLLFIVDMKNRYNQLFNGMSKTKQELSQTKKELDECKRELNQTKNKENQAKQKLNQIKQEFDECKGELNQTKNKENQIKQKLNQIKQELDECKKELKQAKDEKKQSIIVGGYDLYNQLGDKPNHKTKDGYQIIQPPVLWSFDSSLLRSYSVYWCHSVLVNSDGSLKGVGENNSGRISATLQKTSIRDFTDFSIKDCSGNKLTAVSAVCYKYGTLYIFSKSSGNGCQLVLCDCEINEGEPVFLDIGNHHPVSLFGGCCHSAAIGSEGEVIIINRDLVKNSPKSSIPAVSLPDGEKASSVACCSDSVVVLSSNGRVFELPFENKDFKFSIVTELSDQEIVCVSGTNRHCLAVSKENGVFGRGSNKNGQLGLGKGTESVSSFTKILSLKEYEIRAAYAGAGHSLFQTQEGKIISCGSNLCNELLLDSSPGENVYSPTATPISSGASFCIAGDCISAIFICNDPPPNTANIRIHKHE